MDKGILSMVIQIFRLNLIIAIVPTIVISLINILSGIAFVVGTINALINFGINSYVVNKVFRGKRARLLIQISFLLRMLLILGVALLFRENYVNLIFYLVGFIFHQVAIFIYGRKPKQVGLQ